MILGRGGSRCHDMQRHATHHVATEADATRPSATDDPCVPCRPVHALLGVEHSRVHHVVPSLQDLSERPRPGRPSLKTVLALVAVLILLAQGATDAARTNLTHARSLMVEGDLFVDKRLGGVEEECLGVVWPGLVKADGGGQDRARMQVKMEMKGPI